MITISYVGAIMVAAAFFCFGIVCPERLFRTVKKKENQDAVPIGRRRRTMPYINGN